MIKAGIMLKQELEDMLSQNEVNIIDFSATWCGPCKMMAPIVEDAADRNKGKYYFYNIDIDSSEDLANDYKIQFVPTFVVCKFNREIARTSGYMDYEDFIKFIEDSIKKAEK